VQPERQARPPVLLRVRQLFQLKPKIERSLSSSRPG
jgi:hypothetical protein